MNQPQNIEAEKALLSSLFVNPDKFTGVAEIVSAECLYNSKHQAIYRAIENLNTAGESIDPFNVHDELKRQKVDIPLSDIQSVAEYYPTAEIAERHAEAVKEAHTRRAAIVSMHNAILSAQDESQNIRDIISTVQKELDASLPSDTRRKVSSIYPEIMELSEKIVDAESREETYIETGFYDLDEVVILANGTLTILGALPRVGKTSFILCVMRHMAKQGKRPVLFTLEMPRRRILENLIAQEQQVPHQDMVRGRLNQEQQRRILSGLHKWTDTKIGVLDGRWSASEIRHRVVREKREAGADIVFIDPLGKVPAPEGMSRSKRHEVYEANTELFSNLAVELNIPVVLPHHLNREGAKDKPTLFTLNEAGEKFADNVILMHREWLTKPTRDNKDKAEFILAKNRDGDVDTVTLGWNGPTKTFYNLEARRNEPNKYWEE